MTPEEMVQRMEEDPVLPSGDADRFEGYGVIGLPFRSGHVLALRRFPASSIGPAYTSVWHRDPRGAWTFYSTIDPELGCSRYFGPEITHDVVAPIHIVWTGTHQFCVLIGASLQWEVQLRASWTTGLMNGAARLMPESWWQEPVLLKAMGGAARLVLRTGRMNLAGRVPNGHDFVANPRRVWLVGSSRAMVKGRDVGPPGRLAEPARLNDFYIPQRGVFALVRAFLKAPEPAPVRPGVVRVA